MHDKYQGDCCGHGHLHEKGPSHEHEHDDMQLDGLENPWCRCWIIDGACVVSGGCTLYADYEKVRTVLAENLESIAGTVRQDGGIIGHIKASAEIASVEMFSITDMDVMAKKTSGQDIKIHVAAIVFAVEKEKAEIIVKDALQSVMTCLHDS